MHFCVRYKGKGDNMEKVSMKKYYLTPECGVVSLSAVDVLNSSGNTSGGNRGEDVDGDQGIWVG